MSKHKHKHKHKHTPGPWYHLDGVYVDAETPCGFRYCVAKSVKTGKTDKDAIEADANARLIAAAPDMLEALEKIASGDGVYGAQAGEYKRIAREAIVQATGESE